MLKIFVQNRLADLAAQLTGLAYQVECCSETMVFNDLEEHLIHGDIVFWDHIPESGFYGSKANIIVATAKSSATEEHDAAKAGALAYIASDISDEMLKHVIVSVSKGELWMTRDTIATLFDEFVKSKES